MHILHNAKCPLLPLHLPSLVWLLWSPLFPATSCFVPIGLSWTSGNCLSHYNGLPGQRSLLYSFTQVGAVRVKQLGPHGSHLVSS